MTKGKKCDVDGLEQMVGKRIRLPSKYIVSSYTVEAKKRTFEDGTSPSHFSDVDPIKK